MTIIISTVLGLSVVFYLGCFLLSRKLVEDYWQWRFQKLPSWGRFDWTYWLGPCSLSAAFIFRLIHWNQGSLH